MKFSALFVLILLPLIADAVPVSGRWYAVIADKPNKNENVPDGTLAVIGGANIRVTRNGEVKGRALYYTGNETFLTGDMEKARRRVRIQERLGGKLLSSGVDTMSKKGGSFLFNNTQDQQWTGEKIKKTQSFAGVYKGRAESTVGGRKFRGICMAILELDGNTTIYIFIGGSFFSFEDKVRGNIARFTNDSDDQLVGEFRNRGFRGAALLNDNLVTFKMKYL